MSASSRSVPSRREMLAGGLASLAAFSAAPAFALRDADVAPPVIDIDDPRFEQYFNARTALWSTLGTVDDDVIAYLVSPEFSGAPPWLTTRQAYRVVRTPRSLILASDGLSDLFVDTSMSEPGFECEVYLESSDLAGAGFNALAGSWQFRLLQSFAQNVAYFGGINSAIDRYGVVSMELPAPEATPARWVTDRDSVGALINIEVDDRPSRCELEEGVEIRIVALTLILPDETDYIVAGGADARRDLAQRLIASGAGLVSDSARSSVLA